MQKETIAITYGYEKDSNRTMNVPIYQTTAYEYESIEDAALLFELQKEGNIYTRISNPTTRVFEHRIAKLEAGVDALALASGMASIFYSIINLAKSGDNVIISTKLYGGSITLITQTLKPLGIQVKYFDVHNAQQLQELIDDKTRAILFESIANPALSVADFDTITDIADKKGVITICDNTIATPYGCEPFREGVDIVVHSASKYIVGNGSSIAGVIVESQKAKAKLANHEYFSTPDESYHGLVYLDKFNAPFIARARLALLRDFGAVISPFNSWLLIQGLETLSLRIKQHSKSAKKIAKFLKKQGFEVSYPMLKGDENYKYAKKYLKYAGGIVSFDVGDFKKAKKIVKNLKIFNLVTNIGDSKSIVTHPASTTHQQLNAQELKKAGVSEGLIRLSIGLEGCKDLIADLDNAIKSAYGS
ncbi:MAG: O-acetylhomoserine aminocarboxypropyltransferase/cysteine synthase [Epsilonproteobacteria bacterium]|nr:O-acetylhomoserine aminocarboxypropyltransferase/cysteine synthase [Campylobacterota bacterium]